MLLSLSSNHRPRTRWGARRCSALVLLAACLLLGAPATAELSQAWVRTFPTGGDMTLRIKTLTWDEKSGELLLLLRGASTDQSTEASPRATAIWRFNAAGERLGELPLPESLAGSALRGMAVATDALTLVSASNTGLELVPFDRGGELGARRALSGEAADLDPTQTLLLADGTVALAGELDDAVVVMARPGSKQPAVTKIPVEGFGAVLDLAPARGGNVLALVHGRQEIEATYVFTRGEIHIVLLNRDGEIVRRVLLQGRLGSVLDTGRGYAVLLDLGAEQAQQWWLLRFDDDLREIARLQVTELQPFTFPRPSRLLHWPGSGYVGVVAASRGQPWVARFSPKGTVSATYEVPAEPRGPGYSQLLATVGGDALYVVAATYEDDGDAIRDVIKIFKLVEN